ncbi:MAG: molecular chaperone TorD family protein [Thermodesulfovibrionia bacterium]|nr:molecular chaperone TorD family protein [Thermodesulfovibrionia bacterium]
MNINDLILHEKTRENCFRFLAACFYLPQKNLFAEKNLLVNLTKYLQEVCPDAAVFSSEMEKNFLQFSNEELSVEYSKLFVGPFELLAPPYGSVYLEGRRVMGDSTMEAIKVYQKEGLSRSDDFKDLPDHIAVELEFMSYLIYKEIKALESSDFKTTEEFIDKQEDFLNRFLRRWVSPFCEKIKEGTNNGFYTALADCVSTFVLYSNTEKEALLPKT